MESTEREKGIWGAALYIATRMSDACVEYVRIIREEIDLFLGATLALLGLLNWSSNKYCDGNTADYLSCTRPTTYYYYSGFAIVLIIVGVLFLLMWFVKNKHR